MSLAEVAATGNRLETLRALRDRLAEEVERVADDGFCVHCKRGSSSVAAVAARLTDVLEQIAGLEITAEPKKGTVLDEFSARRRGRGSAASVRASAAGSEV